MPEFEALSPVLTKYGFDIAGLVVGLKAVQWLTDFLKRPLRVALKVPTLGRWASWSSWPRPRSSASRSGRAGRARSLP